MPLPPITSIPTRRLTLREVAPVARTAGAPFLRRIVSLPAEFDATRFPFNVPALLLEQSHGESFLALFTNRFEQGIYILDEPEAALSPQRQLSFLKIIHDLVAPGHAQFIIATHSPIILSYPGAVFLSLDGDTIREIAYREPAHYLLTRDFLNAPERYFRHLFDDAANEVGDS